MSFRVVLIMYRYGFVDSPVSLCVVGNRRSWFTRRWRYCTVLYVN